MTKIEERAKDYAERNYSPSFPFDALKLAYRKGATEQRQIDYDKLKGILNDLMLNTHDKCKIIELMEK